MSMYKKRAARAAANAIMGLIEWDQTPEGADYWDEVYKKLGEIADGKRDEEVDPAVRTYYVPEALAELRVAIDKLDVAVDRLESELL